MRKVFVFLSVMLLFIGVALANAPPMVFGTDDSQNEMIVKNSPDQPADVVNITATETSEIASPLVFSMAELPVQTIVMVESGMSDMIDRTTTLMQNAVVWNLIQTDIGLYRSYEKRLHLAKENKQLIMGLSRLNIGKLFVKTS